jgi:2-dehydropantoate 2-reductase
MKICTVGLGAVGGWLTARLLQLQQASHSPTGNPAGNNLQISALARGDTLAAVQQHGLLVHSSAVGTPTSKVSLPLQASSNADDLGVQDLVIVAVKAPALAAAAPSIAAPTPACWWP